MRFWNALLKRTALAAVAAILAFSWISTGHAQAPCQIGRGQDPLDVLNSGVRHNVWIVLDTSGSMGGNFGGGQTKIEAARDVLKEVVDEFVDASGKPLVNWGIVSYDRNSVQQSSACSNQFTNNCVGLALGELVNPPVCSAPSNASVIKSELDAAVRSNGDPRRGGSTPNGISMDQISKEIVNRNFVANLLPNQKNFILLVTDGDDTCECGDNSKNVSNFLTNGVWTPTTNPPYLASNPISRALRGYPMQPTDPQNDPSYSVTVGTNAADIGAINAGTKGRLAYERLNPSPTDLSSGGKGGAFVVGMGLSTSSRARANHMAWESSGAFYASTSAFHALFADNRAQLKDALRDAFARIGVPQSTVTLGAPTVGTVPEVIPTFTNTSLTTADIIGDVGPTTVDPDDIREARTNRANHQENVVFSSTVEVPGFRGHFTAHNIYKVTDPNNPRTARAADFTLMWDAGDKLQQRTPDSRNILFNRRGSKTLLPFNSANVQPSDLNVTAGYLGALTANDARDMVVGVVRGYRLSVHPTTNTLYKPDGKLNFSTVDENGFNTWKLYDAVGAPAVVLAPPRSPDFDPPQNHGTEYGVGGTQVGDGFYWDHFNRKTMVYLPTNGGMMHGFDAATGDEVFAYIPDDVMGLASGEVIGSHDTLKEFVELVVAENNGIQNHQFLMAGSPTVRDAFLRSDAPDFAGDDEWHTLLSFARGRGGRFVSVLDVTDPNAPALRFNVGNREGISDGQLDGLGETWSTPVMGNVPTNNPSSDPDLADQWLVFLGGGYGCNNNSNEGQYVFALRAEDGSVYYRGQVTDNKNASITYNAVVTMPTLYNPHQEDVADNKDFITRAYFGDVQGNVWKLVTSSLNPSQWTLKKFAELGPDEPITAPVTILKDINNQQVYVMAGTGGDLRVSSATKDFRFVTLIDVDNDSSATTQYPLGTAPFWEKILEPNQRVYVAPVTIGVLGQATNPLVFFAASAPEFDNATCTGKFFSSLFALGILSGQAEVDLDGGGPDESVDLGASKVTGLYARNGNLYVSESGGLGQSGSLSVYGDGSFSDDITTGGSGITIQVLVDSFRISPF